MSAVEQVSLSTQQAATHPMKRRSAAELGCFAIRDRLVLTILWSTIKLSYGGVGDSSKREKILALHYSDLST